MTIRVEEREEPGTPGPTRWAVVEVADTGPGIPPDRREEAFEEFTRLGAGELPGAGLGLAISRRLARGQACRLSRDRAPTASP